MGYENVTVVCAVDCPIIEADPVPPPEQLQKKIKLIIYK